jgi:hypothetical protein
MSEKDAVLAYIRDLPATITIQEIMDSLSQVRCVDGQVCPMEPAEKFARLDLGDRPTPRVIGEATEADVQAVMSALFPEDVLAARVLAGIGAWLQSSGAGQAPIADHRPSDAEIKSRLAKWLSSAEAEV